MNIIDFMNNFKFNTLLYDKNYKLYLYDQYSDHEGLSYLFEYFDMKLKQIYIYLGLWMIFKSNQELNSEDILPQEYYTYLTKEYMNIQQLFGESFVKDRWDEGKHWGQPDVKWDNVVASGVLDVRKTKAIMRYLLNLQQKTFNIFDFIKMCKEFCYREKDLKIYVTDDSFINPTTIKVFYNKQNAAIIDLQNILVILKDLFPDYIITFELKVNRGRRKK